MCSFSGIVRCVYRGLMRIYSILTDWPLLVNIHEKSASLGVVWHSPSIPSQLTGWPGHDQQLQFEKTATQFRAMSQLLLRERLQNWPSATGCRKPRFDCSSGKTACMSRLSNKPERSDCMDRYAALCECAQIQFNETDQARYRQAHISQYEAFAREVVNRGLREVIFDADCCLCGGSGHQPLRSAA